MKLIEFPEQNIVIAKDQPQYLPFPAHRLADPEGTVIACWSLSFMERIRILFTGKIWHSILTFKQPLQPQLLSTIKPDMHKQ
jgi:hypothetical protein